MKKLICFTLTLIIFLFTLSNCEKKDGVTDDDSNNKDTLWPLILGKEYTGSLLLVVSNEFPEFEASGLSEVTLDMEGNLTFTTGDLHYSGTSATDEVKIERVGDVVMNPVGKPFLQDNEVYFDVKENTKVWEQMTVWYWNGSTWVQQVNEEVEQIWNGGLVFSLKEAEASASIVEVSTGMGNILWSLQLFPVTEKK